MAIRDIINRIRFGSSKPTALEQSKSMSIRGSAYTRATGAGLRQPGTSPKAYNIVKNIAPAVVTALPGGQASRAGRFMSGAKNVYDRFLGNPLAGGGIKGFFGRIAGRSLGGAAIATGASFTKSAITGDPLDINARRLGYGAVGFGLGGPIGALAGTFFGASTKATGAIKEGISNLSMPNVPSLPTPYDAGESVADVIKALGSGAGQFAQGLTASPSVSASYGVSGPSVSIGSSGFDPTMLLLLLTGGLGAGYLLGKKKKKKRKTKKSKKRKRSKR